MVSGLVVVVMLVTLRRDFGVKTGGIFFVLYKTDEDSNGRDTGKHNYPQSSSNWDRVLLPKNDFPKSECPYRGHGQPHMHKNIYLFPDTKSYGDTC